MIEILKAIALLCQFEVGYLVTKNNGYAIDNTQINCQKYYMKCIGPMNTFKTKDHIVKLQQCINNRPEKF